jgi:hypothetical protein
MASLQARRLGTGRGGGGLPRPCEPDDVILCVDRLYRARRIDVDHVAVLRIWGERQISPVSARGPIDECRLWREAMDYLALPLKAKGIVK